MDMDPKNSLACFFGSGGSDGHLGLAKRLGWQAAHLCAWAELRIP